MLPPTGRAVLTSGANRGIGLALAQVLYAKGWASHPTRVRGAHSRTVQVERQPIGGYNSRY
jgi:NAD(P)-dependent dehydrogenase (short-subunit alcohol dehydrogenase family)